MNDFLGYKLTCKMAKDLKGETGYSENEFYVVIEEDSNSENGYTTTVSGYDEEEGNFSQERDTEEISKHLLFGTWDIVHKNKI